MEGKLFNLSKPVIKWSGSKRSQAELILTHFPNEIDTYYEPFIGGGSVLGKLLCSDIKVNKFICSDINKDLIGLWNGIKNSPDELLYVYKKLHKELMLCKTWADKQGVYNTVREDFNDYTETDTDEDKWLKYGMFMFLNRTCFNGLIRYNSDGKFNTSFHINRNGMNPDTLSDIVHKWGTMLRDKNVEFICQDFSKITPTENDFVYLDPPYANTNGMYGNSDGDNTFNNDKLFNFLRVVKCRWCMSYDGKSGEEDNTFAVPDDIYDLHIYLDSGNSSFKRLKTGKKKDKVLESLYIKM